MPPGRSPTGVWARTREQVVVRETLTSRQQGLGRLTSYVGSRDLLIMCKHRTDREKIMWVGGIGG